MGMKYDELSDYVIRAVSVLVSKARGNVVTLTSYRLRNALKKVIGKNINLTTVDIHLIWIVIKSELKEAIVEEMNKSGKKKVVINVRKFNELRRVRASEENNRHS